MPENNKFLPLILYFFNKNKQNKKMSGHLVKLVTQQQQEECMSSFTHASLVTIQVNDNSLEH